MPRLWTEEEVSLTALAEHFENCGITSVDLKDDRVKLHTDEGLYHCIFIDEGRKFLRFSSYLPIDKTLSRVEKLELVQHFNASYFLTGFALDKDEDLGIGYSVSYEKGLNIGQFMILLHRFRSLLAYIVETDEHRNSVSPGNQDASSDAGDGVDSAANGDASPEEGCFRPKDVLLN